ncbi:MAG: glycosyltransferase [Bacteroidetes bacterium]|nr:glycosyltransferase [Bacteroidota bacterium]
MKISIITAVRNCKDTIRDTIRSVVRQKHSDIEHIVIDGASTDGTREILQDQSDRFTHFVSEPDNGLYDALNKGIELSSGELIGHLNGDDIYQDEMVVSNVVEAINDSEADTAYGDLVYVDRQDTAKVRRYWKSSRMRFDYFPMGWMPPHPTFFVKKKIYETYGGFNTDLRISADYELMLRFLYKHRIPAVYVDRVLIKMREGGMSNASLKNRLEANREDRLAWTINDLKPNWYTRYLKPLSKLGQFIRRKKL